MLQLLDLLKEEVFRAWKYMGFRVEKKMLKNGMMDFSLADAVIFTIRDRLLIFLMKGKLRRVGAYEFKQSGRKINP